MRDPFWWPMAEPPLPGDVLPGEIVWWQSDFNLREGLRYLDIDPGWSP